MILDVLPVGKPRMTQRDRWKQRPPVLRYRAYCDALRLLMPRYELPIALHIKFYMPMPASWSNKKRLAIAGTLHDQKPDVDNLAKGFMDAFKSEDKHVAVLHCEKYWAEKGSVVVDLLYEESI